MNTCLKNNFFTFNRKRYTLNTCIVLFVAKSVFAYAHLSEMHDLSAHTFGIYIACFGCMHRLDIHCICFV